MEYRLPTLCKSHWILAALLSLLMGTLPPLVMGEENTPLSTEDLMNMNLEDLLHVQVTTVSKKSQDLSRAPAAISVITQEDIRRFGATTIPEALRLAPGLDVARINANQWAISSRGFNSRFANKLLVMIDGRSVYTPLFSGVYWEEQDVLLEDIDRIEVVRGPGGTLWGANAVNGVINIITKSSKNTQGGLATTGFGTEEQGFGSIRYGGTFSDDATYRVFGKFQNRDDGGGHDDWRTGMAGFRTDLKWADPNDVMISGDYFDGSMGQSGTTPILSAPFMQTFSKDFEFTSANITSRLTHHFMPDSEATIQSYVNHTHHEVSTIIEDRFTFDLDGQHRFWAGDGNEIVWGAGYRLVRDDIANSFELSLNPDRRTFHLLSSFIQDEMTLLDDHLWLTLGSKFEHNDFSGFEIQPSLRLMGSPAPAHNLWFALSRAVRTPTRVESDGFLRNSVSAGPVVNALVGNHEIQSEDLLAVEWGYRVQATQNLSFDTAFYFNHYDNLVSTDLASPFLANGPNTPQVVVPFIARNSNSADTYGAELEARWEVQENWTLKAGYSYLDIHMYREPGTNDPFFRSAEGTSPEHQAQVRSLVNLPHHVEWDTGLRYVSALSSLNIDGYLVGDMRVGWRPSPQWECSIVSQNLWDRHREFRNSLIDNSATFSETSIYGKITYRF